VADEERAGGRRWRAEIVSLMVGRCRCWFGLAGAGFFERKILAAG